MKNVFVSSSDVTLHILYVGFSGWSLVNRPRLSRRNRAIDCWGSGKKAFPNSSAIALARCSRYSAKLFCLSVGVSHLRDFLIIGLVSDDSSPDALLSNSTAFSCSLVSHVPAAAPAASSAAPATRFLNKVGCLYGIDLLPLVDSIAGPRLDAISSSKFGWTM